MGSPLVTSGMSAMCPHGGGIIVTGNARVLASGDPVLTMRDAGIIAGCPSLAADHPHPCVSVRWTGFAARVLISGQPPVTQVAAGICLTGNQTPAGPVIVVAGQSRITVA